MRKAFSLIELLVVISIIALLIAILLPVLKQSRYQGNLVKCKAVLHGIAGVQLSYAIDNDEFFPTGRPRYEGGGGWFEAQEVGAQVRSWELYRGGSNGYDLRPIYYDYMQNNETDAVMQCPMANSKFLQNNKDERIISYMLYTSNNYRMKHFYMEEVGGYERVSDTWSPEGDHDQEFTMLASDFAFGTFQPHGRPDLKGALVAHPASNGYIEEHLAEINDAGGYVVGSTQSSPTNFADVDGSVHTFKINAESYLDTDNWVVNRHHRGKDALIPKELAR